MTLVRAALGSRTCRRRRAAGDTRRYSSAYVAAAAFRGRKTVLLVPVILRCAAAHAPIGTAGHGPEDRRPQGAGLGRPADLHRPVADVGIDLHHQRVLLGDAAAVDHFLDLHAILLEAIDDRQRAERRGLDQRAIDLGSRRVQRLPDQQAASAADRPGSCGCRCSSPGPAGRWRPAAAARLRASSGRADPRPWPCTRRSQMLDEPVENVTHGRLARFQAVHAGDDRAGNDPAQAGDIVQRLCPAARR